MNQYIKRDMEAVVLKLSKQYPAILVTGPIQVGKTTMLQNLMKGTERNYVTLDNLEDRKLAKEDPEMFFQKYKTPILIDEIQYAPNLFTYIKIQIDKNKKAGEFWLTGSQIFKLMKGVTESLAGRMAILNLNSLSQNEIYNQYENKPFELDFEKLNEKAKKVRLCDTKEMFERIYRGSMPFIIKDDAKVTAVPEVVANVVDANLIHEAAIGKIAGEQITKLRTLGLTEEEAEQEIIKGFLR